MVGTYPLDSLLWLSAMHTAPMPYFPAVPEIFTCFKILQLDSLLGPVSKKPEQWSLHVSVKNQSVWWEQAGQMLLFQEIQNLHHQPPRGRLCQDNAFFKNLETSPLLQKNYFVAIWSAGLLTSESILMFCGDWTDTDKAIKSSERH